jgi:hypothetical protein
MRYRILDANGDMTFGSGSNNYYYNVPAAVAQAVQTRLMLRQGEWFLDTSDGTPWLQQILGKSTQQVRDMLLKARIIQTQGVNALVSYNSKTNVTTRALAVSGTLDTIYGEVTLIPAGPTGQSGAQLDSTFILNVSTLG